MGCQRPDLNSPTSSSSPANLCHRRQTTRSTRGSRKNADPPPHETFLLEGQIKSGLIQVSTGCDSQLCCWLLSLLLILQDKILPCPLLQEDRKCVLWVFLTPLFLHCGCPAVHGQCSTMHSMQRACPDGRYTDPRSTLPQAAPLSLGQDTPLCPGLRTRLAPHQLHSPADTQAP